MTVRNATYSDIPAVFDLIVEAHSRSVYVDRDVVDPKELRSLLVTSMQRSRATSEGGRLFLVSEIDGAIVGVMIGLLDRVYLFGTKLMATDLVFYMKAGADYRDGVKMVVKLLDWAGENPNVVEVKLGATNVIADTDFRKVAKIYERAGLTECGVMYEWRISR